jgi:energy-coupling factor transporter ATP-binding protein EcfA2
VVESGEELQPERQILTVSVEELFGRYTYNLPEKEPKINDRLAILYGDNGAGKTTILKLLHHTISCATSRGHKTAVAQIPFRKFCITFSEGFQLLATREKAEAGTFRMELLMDGTPLRSAIFETEDGAIPVQGSRSAEQDEFLAAVRITLNVNSYFLGDNRRLESDAISSDDIEEEVISSLPRYPTPRDVMMQRHLQIEESRDVQLIAAVNRALDWVRNSALSAANLGSRNANTIYSEVVKQLSVDTSPHDNASETVSLDAIIAYLSELSERSASQAEFGLAPRFDPSDMLDSLRRAPAERQDLIIRLLQPHLDGIRARLDALEQLYSILERVTSHLNSFLTDKTVAFRLHRGFSIRAEGGLALPFEVLSSGEKQLFMLFCNLLFARQHASIFLVDEPELSLNVKWQRRLIPALLECTVGSSTQLFLASHSIELISKNRSRVVPLRFSK